jgi:transcriptional regulator with XRE-family HTH domain
MTQTLTEVRRVAWEVEGIGPDPARFLVIFKQVAGGKVLHEVLKPGEVFRRPFLASVNAYRAYAVSTDPHLRHSFSRKFQSSRQARSFVLHFDLEFRVSEPRDLALGMESGDPVQRMEEEVARVLGATARRFAWEELKEEAADFGPLLLEAETADSRGERKSNFARLRAFAESLGLRLERISITRSLLEDALSAALKLVQEGDLLQTEQTGNALAFERENMKQERDWLAMQGRDALRGIARLQMFLDAINVDALRAFSQAAVEVRSFAAIHNALREIQAIQASFSALSAESLAALSDDSTGLALGTGTPDALLLEGASAFAFLHSHGIRVAPESFDSMVREAIERLPRTLYRLDPRADLTEVEAAALESGGFTLEPANLGDDDPLARTAAEYAALLNASLSTQAFAERLGVDPSRIRQRLTSEPPSLYGIRLHAGWVIPEFQLDGDRLLPGLGEVVARLDSELHPLTVYRWFTLPNPDLPAESLPGSTVSPRDWLRLGLPAEPVAELAADL